LVLALVDKEIMVEEALIKVVLTLEVVAAVLEAQEKEEQSLLVAQIQIEQHMVEQEFQVQFLELL
jgi:hypothetical protein